MSKHLDKFGDTKVSRNLFSRAASPDEEVFKTWAKKELSHEFEDVALHFLASIEHKESRITYFHSLKVFSSWADNMDIREISPSLLSGWREAQKLRSMKPATIRKNFSALSSLFRYAMGLGLIDKNPIDLLIKKRYDSSEDTKTPSLKPETMKEILVYLETKGSELFPEREISPRNLRGWQTYRLRHAFVAVMAFALARVTSVTTLRIKDFYFDSEEDGWRLRFKVKGGKTLTPLIHPELSKILISYIKDFREGSKLSDPLFINIQSLIKKDIDGNNSRIQTEGVIQTVDNPKPLTRQAANFWLKELVSEINLTEALHPHVIRTTGINALRLSGEPIENTQKLAGHAEITTTAKYYRLTDGKTESASLRINYKTTP